MAHTLIVLPEDTARPVIDAINSASLSLRVKMFVLSEPSLLAALVAARRRGVTVRVLLNPLRRSGERENEASRRALARAHVEVKDANPAFDITHEKSMVVDEKIAFVGSFNWTPKNVAESRDYGLITSRDREVEEIAHCFDADWRRRAFTPAGDTPLVWAPNHGRERIAEFIDAAKDRLAVQNERFQDMMIIDCLLRAARRGVKVHVMAKAPHTLKHDKLVEGVGGLRILQDSGVKVHKLKGMALHAKMFVADGLAAVIGSMNLAPGSFDSRRELGIHTRDSAVVERLEKTAHRDWKHSVPLDLSDEGLLADLESRVRDAKELLALNGRHR